MLRRCARRSNSLRRAAPQARPALLAVLVRQEQAVRTALAQAPLSAPDVSESAAHVTVNARLRARLSLQACSETVCLAPSVIAVPLILAR